MQCVRNCGLEPVLYLKQLISREWELPVSFKCSSDKVHAYSGAMSAASGDKKSVCSFLNKRQKEPTCVGELVCFTIGVVEVREVFALPLHKCASLSC